MKNLYNLKNINTKQVWTNLDAGQIGEILGISVITVRQYARIYGAYREFEITPVEQTLKNPHKAFNADLINEWDRYVPKLNKRLKELKLNIPVVEG